MLKYKISLPKQDTDVYVEHLIDAENIFNRWIFEGEDEIRLYEGVEEAPDEDVFWQLIDAYDKQEEVI